VIGGIAKKDAKGGPRRELVQRCGGQVRVASTTEHTEMCVGWMGSVQVEEGRPEVERLGGEAVQQVSCRVKAFDPVRGREGCLKQHGAHDVVNGTNHTLSFTVLGGGVRARHP